MTSAELIRWSRKHEARATGAWWRSWVAIVVACGGPLAAWVGSRGSANLVGESHAWLAGSLAIFAIAFLRVPFLVYWRADAPLLAQLPIEGAALFDAALVRCLEAAAIATTASAIGALPILDLSPALALRHVALAGALGATAAFGMPAVVIAAAALLQQGIVDKVTSLAGASVASAATGPTTGGSSAMLGALPGFAATGAIVVVIVASPWLVGRPASLPGPLAVAGLAAASAILLALVRGSAGRRMGAILRDVSALDRQRLATLEIRGPTAIERAIARLVGDGALAYAKDARLVRRRYPMAFALGAMTFLVLAIVGIAIPDEPTSWIVVPVVGAAAYAVVLAGRLRHPPIELPRLSATLPIARAAQRRAKFAWLAGWWGIFVVAPGGFAIARCADLTGVLALAAATVAVGLKGGLDQWLPDRTTSSRAANVSGA